MEMLAFVQSSYVIIRISAIVVAFLYANGYSSLHGFLGLP